MRAWRMHCHCGGDTAQALAGKKRRSTGSSVARVASWGTCGVVLTLAVLTAGSPSRGVRLCCCFPLRVIAGRCERVFLSAHLRIRCGQMFQGLRGAESARRSLGAVCRGGECLRTLGGHIARRAGVAACALRRRLAAHLRASGVGVAARPCGSISDRGSCACHRTPCVL